MPVGLSANIAQVTGYVPAVLKTRVVNLRRYNPHLSISRVVEEALADYVPRQEQALMNGELQRELQQRRRYRKQLRAAPAEPEAEPPRRARTRTTVWDHDPI